MARVRRIDPGAKKIENDTFASDAISLEGISRDMSTSIQTARPQPPRPAAGGDATLWTLLMFVAIGLAGVIGLAIFPPSCRAPSSPQDQVDAKFGTRAEAIGVAENAVKKGLVNKHDAEFRRGREKAILFKPFEKYPKMRFWLVVGLVKVVTRGGANVTREYRAFVARDGVEWRCLFAWIVGEQDEPVYVDPNLAADMVASLHTTAEGLIGMMYEQSYGKIKPLE